MSPTGWVKSALSPTPQTAVELLSRLPSTFSMTGLLAVLADLTKQGAVTRHEPTGDQVVATFTRVIP